MSENHLSNKVAFHWLTDSYPAYSTLARHDLLPESTCIRIAGISILRVVSRQLCSSMYDIYSSMSVCTMCRPYLQCRLTRALLQAAWRTFTHCTKAHHIFSRFLCVSSIEYASICLLLVCAALLNDAWDGKSVAYYFYSFFWISISTAAPWSPLEAALRLVYSFSECGPQYTQMVSTRVHLNVCFKHCN